MPDDDWVDRVKKSDDATQTLREALEKSLNDASLQDFNCDLKKLVKEEAHSHILGSTPLELVPILLLSNDAITANPQTLQETYELIARHGSPKEVLIVVQESLDGLLREAKELENDEDTTYSTPSQIVWKWLRLIDMYTFALPRLLPRKRSAPETATPLIQHLRNSFTSLGQLVDPNEPVSRELVEACMRLGYALLRWFDTTNSKVDEIETCKTALQQLLCTAIAECLSDTHVLQEYNDFLHRLRTAGLAFTPVESTKPAPRMTIHTRSQSIGAFILYYLSNRGPVRPKGTRQALKKQLPGLLVALQRLKWRQTALGAINDCVLGLYDEEFLEDDVAAEIIPASLFFTIIVISIPASTDPDSKSRATLFNLLTRIILKVQPVHAFKFVRDLASEECPYLNMRSSAIGLLRRLVVRAFSQNQPSNDDPFASRLLLEEYKPILLQSSILEEKDIEGSKSIDTQEMNRLVEVLGFFYVLLARDEVNLSGVRDAQTIQELKDKLIEPLKRLIPEMESSSDDPSLLFSVRSVSISLERIEDIISVLNS